MNPRPQVENMGWSLKLTFPASLKWLPHLPSYILLCKMCHHQLCQIPFFSPSHPRPKHLSLTLKQLSFPGWRQNSNLFHLFPWTKETWLCLPPHCSHCTVGGMTCTVLSILLSMKIPQTQGQGQIFKQGAEVQFLAIAHTAYLHL